MTSSVREYGALRPRTRALSLALAGILLTAIPAASVSAAPLPAPLSDPLISVTYADQNPQSGFITATFTSDGSGKVGESWSLTNTLPDGVVIADPAQATTSCGVSSIDALAGSNTITLTGASDESCSFTVDLTASNFVETGDAPQTYKNCANDFSDVVGARLDTRCGVLTFRAKPVTEPYTDTVEFDGQGTGTSLHYFVQITNLGDMDFTDDYPSELSVNIADVLDDATYNDDAVMTIDGVEVGTVNRQDEYLGWAGPLEAGSTGELTFSVQVLETSPTSQGDRRLIAESCVPTYQANDNQYRCHERGIDNNLIPFLDTGWLPGDSDVTGVQPSEGIEIGTPIDFYWAYNNDSAGLLTDLMPNITSVNRTATTTETSGFTIDCPAVVPPGGKGVCHGQRLATAADVAEQFVEIDSVLQGNVEGVAVEGNFRSSYSDYPRPAAFRVIGDTPPLKDVKAGDTFDFVYRIQNQGGHPLTDFVLAQRGGGTTGEIGAIECPADMEPLAPSDVAYCTAEYTVTEEDVVYGNVFSSLAISATSTLSGEEVDTVSGQNFISMQNRPELRISTPTVSGTDGILPGEVMQLHYKVRNIGPIVLTDTTLESLTFSGENALSNIVCEDPTLSANEVTTCTADYTVTQADLDGSLLISTTQAVAMADVVGPSAGRVASDSVALGFTDAGKTDDWRERDPSYAVPTEIRSNTAHGASFLDPAKQLLSDSEADATELDAADVPVAFTFSFTNSGNTTLDNVELVPAEFVGDGDLGEFVCPANVSLAPGEDMSCVADYTTTEGDLAAGFIENSAFAVADTREGDVVFSPLATTRVVLASDTGTPVEPTDPVEPTNPVEPTDPADPATPESPDEPKKLAWTGSAAPIAGGLAAAILLTMGISFMISSRKRRASDELELITK